MFPLAPFLEKTIRLRAHARTVPRLRVPPFFSSNFNLTNQPLRKTIASAKKNH